MALTVKVENGMISVHVPEPTLYWSVYPGVELIFDRVTCPSPLVPRLSIAKNWADVGPTGYGSVKLADAHDVRPKTRNAAMLRNKIFFTFSFFAYKWKIASPHAPLGLPSSLFYLLCASIFLVTLCVTIFPANEASGRPNEVSDLPSVFQGRSSICLLLFPLPSP
jgi:hypothetical protein